MATKSLFNHINVQSEQDLVESLIIEAIQIYGIDMYYIPQTLANSDPLFGEDSGTTKYEIAYPIEMYVKNVEGFEGDGNFLSTFGMEVRDQITLSVARKRFDELETGFVMPREGDAIWFPLTNSMYEIQFTEDESIFYQMGELMIYDIQCELMEYSNQVFNTGITEIDNYGLTLATGSEYNLILASGVTASGNEYIIGETVYQGISLEDALMTGQVKEFDSELQTVTLVHTTTNPTDNTELIGVDSDASWLIDLPTENEEEVNMKSTGDDNWDIEMEADEFIDFEESNPFGKF